MGMRLKHGQLAEAIGVHPETLGKWRKAGMPCVQSGVGRGGAVIYDLAEVFAWVRDTGRHMPSDDDEGLSPAIESAKLSKARRLKVDLDRRLKAAELVSATGVIRAIFPMFRAVRDAVLALPDRVSSVLANTTDENEVHALLSAESRAVLAGVETEIWALAGSLGAAHPQQAEESQPKEGDG